MDILSISTRIQNLEISLSEARRKTFSLETKLEETKQVIDFLEFQAKKEVVFDSTLKNAEQRDIKAQEILSEKKSYSEAKKEISQIKKDIFEAYEVEKNLKSEVEFYKRMFQIALSQIKVEA